MEDEHVRITQQVLFALQTLLGFHRIIRIIEHRPGTSLLEVLRELLDLIKLFKCNSPQGVNQLQYYLKVSFVNCQYLLTDEPWRCYSVFQPFVRYVLLLLFPQVPRIYKGSR